MEAGTQARGGAERPDRELLGRRPTQLAVVVLLTAVIGVVRAVLIEDLAIGVGFAFMLPIGLATWWFGRRAGLLWAALCLVVWLAVTLAPISPVTDPLAPAAVIRGLAFLITVLLVSELRERTRQVELSHMELEALRQALTPPKLPATPGMDVAVVFAPGERGVSGDFYLVARHHERSTFIVGDVVGRGPQASQRATFARAVLASIAREESDPGEVLRLANLVFCEHWAEDGDFLTAVCVTYEPVTHKVAWAVGGHPAPLTLRGRVALEGEWTGPLLALDADATFSTQRAALPPGEGLLIYTDGLIEARASDGELFGIDRVLAVLAAHQAETTDRIVRVLHDELDRFVGVPVADDVCLFALRATARSH